MNAHATADYNSPEMKTAQMPIHYDIFRPRKTTATRMNSHPKQHRFISQTKETRQKNIQYMIHLQKVQKKATSIYGIISHHSKFLWVGDSKRGKGSFWKDVMFCFMSWVLITWEIHFVKFNLAIHIYAFFFPYTSIKIYKNKIKHLDSLLLVYKHINIDKCGKS